MGKLVNKSMIYRLLVSIVYVPFFLYLFDFGGMPYFLFILGLVAVMSYEFFQILVAKGLQPYFKMGIIASVIVAISMYYVSANSTYLVFTLLVIILSVNELKRKKTKNSIMHISTTVFGVVYTGWLGGHFLLLRQLSGAKFNSSILVFFALYMIWLADTGAFFVGSVIGKHKVISAISPKKTYEGLIGGIIFSIVAGMIFKYFWFNIIPLIDIIILGFVAALGGLAGDLVESAMKRDANIKDVSSFLPGHGGVLDRFDSVLFALPLIYYYFLFIIIPRL